MLSWEIRLLPGTSVSHLSVTYVKFLHYFDTNITILFIFFLDDRHETSFGFCFLIISMEKILLRVFIHDVD